MIKAYPCVSTFLFHEDSSLLPGVEFIHLQATKLKYLKKVYLKNMFKIHFFWGKIYIKIRMSIISNVEHSKFSSD